MKDLNQEPEQTLQEAFSLVDYDLQVQEYEDGQADHLKVPMLSLTSLWPVHEFVSEVLRSRRPGFHIDKLESARKVKEELPLGRRFLRVKSFLTLMPEGVEFYGLVGLFFDSCDQLKINPVFLTRPGLPYLDGKVCAEVFNELLDCIREKAASGKYKKVVSDLKRKVDRNFKSMKDYVDALFEKHSKLLVLRVDLGYHRSQGRPIRWERAKNDFERLLNNRRSNRLFEHMVGYVRRLEYGLEKSWHLHVMLFFDGQELQNHAVLARLVGEYWKTTITDNDGTFFNCNDSRNEYKYCGIGKVDHADAQSRTHLFYALSYLTKKDEILGFGLPDKCKMIVRGEMPVIPRVKQGRRRKQGRVIKGMQVIPPIGGGT